MKTVQKQLKLEKNKIDVDSLKEGQKEFITNNKLILKHNKYLKVKSEMLLLKVLPVIKECNQFLQQKHIHME